MMTQRKGWSDDREDGTGTDARPDLPSLRRWRLGAAAVAGGNLSGGLVAKSRPTCYKTSPCPAACPSGHDVRGWLAIARGQDKGSDGTPWQEYAFRRMAAANPFPAVMGRVCPHPARTVAIATKSRTGSASTPGALHRQLGAGKRHRLWRHRRRDRQACGGGRRRPGRLAAAYHLRRRGHGVTIFEGRAALGGMMLFGIPGYRTPRDVLDGEIGRIVAMGVEVRLNTRIGRTSPWPSWTAITTRCSGRSALKVVARCRCRGPMRPTAITGVAFLGAFNEGRLQAVSGNVVVVGGGDTSIDVASVARRLGDITHMHEKDRPENVVLGQTAHDVASAARREGAAVVLTSLFPIEKMTAAERELDDAQHEGVEIRGSVMPLEVLKDASGRARALCLCRARWIACGRSRSPAPSSRSNAT